MVDYKKIVNAIPEVELNASLAALTDDFRFMELSTVETCYNSIKDTTETINRGDVKYNYSALSGEIGIATASQLEASVIAAIEGNDLPKWVNTSLNTLGININDPQIAGALAILVPYGLTQPMIDDILSVQNETKVIFQGLKLGHVQNAIQKRAEGVI